MEKLGELTMSFKELRDGIYYSNLTITTDAVTRTITLPRYHTFVGWVEIFGLAPQFEWLVLGDIPAFSKTAALVIDDTEYVEAVTYTPKPETQQHQIKVERSRGTVFENCLFTETYTDAPTKIQLDLQCDHSEGTYSCASTKGLTTLADLGDDQYTFAADIIAQHGATDQIWQKQYTAQGVLPPIYYHFFPPIPGVDLTDIRGSIVEVGYLAAGDAIDRLHGEWFKHITVNEHQFYIHEHSYGSKIITTPAGDECVKDTYVKELYRIV